jgi:AcrR family transcriptional regulator
MTDVLPHTLRVDAPENRDRVLDAARELFAERGVDVTMREIARHAGVGPATLYRRFPTKRALIDEAFADEMRACRRIVVDGHAEPDPWHGFCSVIEGITALNARNHGFVDAFLSANPEFEAIGAHRASLFRMLADLAARAQRAGSLRSDFVMDDLLLVLMAGRSLTFARPEQRARAATRFARLAIDALREPGRRSPQP